MVAHVTTLARRRLLVAALSGAAAALAACGPLPVPGADQPTPAAKSAAAAAGASTPAPAAAPARAVAPATVRLLTHFARDGKTPREVALKAITDKFEADHAGLKIGFEVIPWPDIPAKFMAGHEGGNGPDLIKDLFEGTGLETTRPTTWAGFVDAARKAMRDAAGRKGGEAGFDVKTAKTWGFGHYKGREKGGSVPIERTMLELGESVIKPETGEASWVGEAGSKSMAMWTAMMKEQQIQPPSDLQASLDDSDNNFAGGVYGSYLVGAHRYGGMRQNYTFPEENVGFLRMPTFKGEKYGPANVETRGLCLWSGSKVADQTWAYGEFLVSPWADGKMALGGELIPIRTSVAQTPEFKNLPARLSHLNLLSQAVADWGYSNPPAPVPYAPHLLLAYHRIVSENVPVEKALQDSAADYNKQVAESKKK